MLNVKPEEDSAEDLAVDPDAAAICDWSCATAARSSESEAPEVVAGAVPAIVVEAEVEVEGAGGR